LLVGREPHLRVLTGAVSDALNGRARTVTVYGEAGSGKTALLDAVTAEAEAEAEEAAAMRVIRIAGHPAEHDLPLAGVHHLLREAGLREVGPDGVLGTEGADPLRDAAALLDALTTLAGRQPLLLVIDDAQWLDRPSHRALVFVARRLDADALCVLFGVRAPQEDRLMVGTRLEVGPLSRDESVGLLRQSYPQMSARVAAKIAGHAHGLPLALCEIPASLGTAQLEGSEPLPPDLPLGRSLAHLFDQRIAALPDATRLCLLAASFDSLSAAGYLASINELGCGLVDLDEAERAGLARLRAGRCEFRHPLVAAAVRAEARAQQLVAVHRVLANRFADDPVRLAAHLRHDPDVDSGTLLSVLEKGAAAAADARSHDEAAELWVAAADLVTEPEHRRRLLGRAVSCLALAGAGPEARALIEQLLIDTNDTNDTAGVTGAAQTTVAAERAGVLHDLTWVSLWTQSIPPADDEMIESESLTLIKAGDHRSQEAGARLLAALATALLGAGEYRRAQKVCLALRTHVAERLTLEQRLLCDVIEVMVGEPGAGSLLRDGTSWVDAYPWQHILDPSTSAGFITVVLGWLGEYETLDRVIAHARTATDEHGPSASALYIASSMTASRERHHGRWDRALLGFATLEQIVIDTDFAAPYPFIALRHAHLLAARGDAEACHRLRQRARDKAPVWAPALAHLDHAVAGLLALADRDYTTALSHLDLAGQIERDVGLAPSGYLSRFADMFEAAWRLGEAESRLHELKQFEDAMHTVRHDTMLGLAARCRALVAPPEDMDTAFTEAVERLGTEPGGYETARTHLLWGERLRRARRKADAHQKLTLAHATFTRLGATAWAGQCASELAACGIRRTTAPERAGGPLSQLTPREYEVAREVATGLTNAEAARRLFISERTVEFHLYNVFRKLGIDSRGALTTTINT
jgi:DNA-binding CsgD family transcriptional regulator